MSIFTDLPTMVMNFCALLFLCGSLKLHKRQKKSWLTKLSELPQKISAIQNINQKLRHLPVGGETK